MSANLGERFNLDEQIGAVNAATQFTRLIMLDRVWTDYLQHARPPIPEGDIHRLGKLTTTMSQLLQESPDDAGYLSHIVDKHADELESEYARVIAGNDLTEQAKAALADLVRREGGIVECAKRGTDQILKNAHAERAALEAKMDIIRRGGFSPGDLSSKFLCGLGKGLIIGCLIAPFPANIVGVSAGAALILGMELTGEGC